MFETKKKIKINTLGLNMIVAEDDIELLKRALKSIDAKNYFDEIVLVFTQTRGIIIPDLDLHKYFKNKYNAKCFTIEWETERYPYGNFARTRNYALDNSTTDYIFWMDCDDILVTKIKDKGSMDTIKRYIQLQHWLQYRIVYKINLQNDGNFANSLVRERIFKRDKNVRWKFPVHEQITFPKNCDAATFSSNIYLEHRDNKQSNKRRNRNKKILEHEIKILGKDCPTFLKYYYAVECLNEIKKEQFPESENNKKLKKASVETLKELLFERDCFSQTIYAGIAFTIAKELLYNDSQGSKLVNNKYDKNKFKEIETYANISLGLNAVHAEPFIILGDVHLYKEDFERSKNYYREALNRKMESVFPQQRQFYEEIPLLRLLHLFELSEDYEKSIIYWKKLMKMFPSNIKFQNLGKTLINKLSEQIFKIISLQQVKLEDKENE